ncbi:MAG: DUF559 domain-containing protein [Nocardioidaceae bacterium]
MMVAPSYPAHPFTRTRAEELGISRRRLDTDLSNRRVRRLMRGVFVRNDVPDSILLRAQAARLVMTPFVVACDRTAAWLHGVNTLDLFELEVLPRLETYALRGHEPTHRGEVAGGSRDLLLEDITVVARVPVTTPLRTALDLGCKLSPRHGLAAIDALMRAHGFTEADIRALLPRYFRRRGVVRLREIAPLADPRAESVSESWVRWEIAARGLPIPDLQVWVAVNGVPTYRLDLAYPKHKIAVEYDGEQFHSSPRQRRYDAARRAWLRAHGWLVIVLTKESFTAEAIHEWTGRLRTALAR